MCYTCIVVRVRAPHRGVHGHLENGRAAVNHIHLSKTAFKNEPKHAFKNEPKHAFKNEPKHAFKNDHLPTRPPVPTPPAKDSRGLERSSFVRTDGVPTSAAL